MSLHNGCNHISIARLPSQKRLRVWVKGPLGMVRLPGLPSQKRLRVWVKGPPRDGEAARPPVAEAARQPGVLAELAPRTAGVKHFMKAVRAGTHATTEYVVKEVGREYDV